jgi:glycosyltransferase involved in cell wall biosynthesis
VRVGINLLYLVPGAVGGSETYARELIAALTRLRPDDEFVVYCGNEAAASLPDPTWGSNVRVENLGFDAANKPRRILEELFRLPRRAKRDGVDLLHSLGTTSPLHGSTPRVVSVLDLVFHHYPQTFPRPAQRGLELLVPRGARRAKRVIAISQATKDDLVGSYGIDAQKIDVTLLGHGISDVGSVTDEQALRERLGLGEQRFVLCVASGLAHKNIPRLLESFAKVAPNTNLVLTGHAGLDQDALRARAAELGLADRVIFTGWVSSADLNGLYAATDAFVYPTLLEGFGLPVLEAMARGVAVACSNTSSLPEVAGDAALLFDPLDPAEIAAAVERLLSDDELRESLIARGHARAAQFTWQRCAEQTLATYERAIAA